MMFKILEGKKVKTYKEDDGKTVVHDWDCKRPLYETNDIDKVFKMFERLCEEAYRSHMLLIVDFGVMSRKQALKCNTRRNVFLCDDNIDDVTPYITLGEWHYDDREYNGFSSPELYIRNGSFTIGKNFKSAQQVISYFLEKYEREPISMFYVEYSDQGDDTFRKIRKVIDSNLMFASHSNSRGKLYGCTRIRTERFFDYDLDDEENIDKVPHKKQITKNNDILVDE